MNIVCYCFTICLIPHYFVDFVIAYATVSDLSSHPAWKVLNSFECGESAADRIIGGTRAALGQFPWIARLGYVFPYDQEIDWMCGGTLITDSMVITAGHCIPSEEDEFTLKYIRLGEHNINTDPDCELSVCAPAVQDRGFKMIYMHPSFNTPPFHNDIAAIVLLSPVNLNDYVAPICIPQHHEQLAGVKIGEHVLAAGWGKMNMTTEDRAEILQVVSDSLIFNMIYVCEHAFEGPNHYIRFDKPQILAREQRFVPRMLREAIEIRKHPNFNRDEGWSVPPAWDPIINKLIPTKTHIARPDDLPIVQPYMCDLFGKEFKVTASEICAGAQVNKDACGGDSGGPLMKVYDTDDGPKTFLVGVVSFGPTICGIQKPGVYTSVIYFLKWILDNVM